MECDIQCIGRDACESITINAESSSNLLIIATNRQFPSLYRATINCPVNAECQIVCVGGYACEWIIINATLSSNLLAIGDNYAFYDTNVFCPDNGPYSIDNDANCVFQDIEQDPMYDASPFYYLNIYAVEGFNDVYFDCDGACTYHGSLLCTQDYSERCSIGDILTACDSAHICDDFMLTVSPTMDTAEPTSIPTTPTFAPTMEPTKPTSNPTDAPSLHPTLPSDGPTNDPSTA